MKTSLKTQSPLQAYYLTLAQQLFSVPYQISRHLPVQNQSMNALSGKQIFTFNQNFYPSPYLSSAYPQNYNLAKYRSSSLPSQPLVLRPKGNHFSYYDQLKKRDYIATKNYRAMSELKKDYEMLKQKSYQNLNQNNLNLHSQKAYLQNINSTASIQSADLNRFSKYNNCQTDSKEAFLSKIGLVKTNIKMYEIPEQRNRITQIQSNFQSRSSPKRIVQIERQQIKPQNETPLIDCSIEVKSADDGQYYSIFESKCPAILKNHKTFYDPQNDVIKSQAIIINQTHNTFPYETKPLQKYQPNSQKNDKSLVYADIGSQTNLKSKSKNYDTYVVRRRSSPTKSPQKYLPNLVQQNQYLESMQKKFTPQKKNEQFQQIKSPIKRKIIIEYQIDKAKKHKNPQKSTKKKSTVKTHAQNGGLKYYYSKYYIAQQQNKRKNRSKSGSIRKSQKSDKMSTAKRESSKQQTKQNSTKIIKNFKSPKNKQKATRPCQKNYVSTHLLDLAGKK